MVEQHCVCRRHVRKHVRRRRNVLDSKGQICHKCSACFFCTRCIATRACVGHDAECPQFAISRRQGFLVKGNPGPHSFNVAWKKKAFGEGAERLAFKFRFLKRFEKNKKSEVKFDGPIMVAKESRFVEDFDASSKSYLRSHRHTYHKTFLRTQATASKYSTSFNSTLKGLLPEKELDFVPILKFLEPMIFELEDATNDATYNVLVEPLIKGKFRKFSDNKGNLAPEVKRDFFLENRNLDLQSAALLLGRKVPAVATSANGNNDVSAGVTSGGLGAIVEGSEDEEDEDTSDDDIDDEEEEFASDSFRASSVRNVEYLETFSHFTFEKSRGGQIVVDLQGIIQKEEDKRDVFMLTDPAIHSNRGRENGKDSKQQFGRTNLGRRGVKAFFQTHVCNNACRLLNLKNRERK